jgi:UDP-GlcNAc:undecaprenyl-phosphate/decaprenyl-phosphate GlcNAc-1-phosphate transferase
MTGIGWGGGARRRRVPAEPAIPGAGGSGGSPPGEQSGGSSPRASAATAALAAAAAQGAYRLLCRRPPGGQGTWTRTNHRGEPVTLLAGPAVAAGAALAAVASPGLPGRARAALLAAAAGAAACGGYDDLAGSGDRRGFRGHLGALAHGELTTGAVKLGGIGATGLTASVLLGGGPVDALLNAGLIAGGANLVNLFDLRPGRASKVTVASGGLLAAAAPAAAPLAAVPVGAALALLGEDLGERAMLGDAGANALGALLGTAAAAGLRRPARIALLTGIVGLTAASEVVSFTKVIERTRPLRWLDMLGRRPVPAAAPAPAQPAPASTR